MERYPINQNFFRKQYENSVSRFNNNLLKTLRSTKDFKLLFKYLFPLDRMLSLTNIYSYTYLSGLRDIDGVFDTTKENIKQLFFILNGAGNPYCPTYPSNVDLMDALLNGLDIPGLAKQLVIMVAKSVLMIFKGFMEIADLNIAMTRKIIDIIHLANLAIAEGQRIANEGHKIGASIDDLFSKCETRVDDAEERIIEEAIEMINWARKIIRISEANPDWPVARIVQEILDEPTGIQANFPVAKQEPSFILSNKLVDNPEWDAAYRAQGNIDLVALPSGPTREIATAWEEIFEEAKELNPNGNKLEKIAEQQCEAEGCTQPPPQAPGVPPDDWFDPINETFIPEPQAWQISLAIFPGLLIPPLNGNSVRKCRFWACLLGA